MASILPVASLLVLCALLGPVAHARLLLQDPATPPAEIGLAGQELNGFTFGTNVTVYASISKDVCSIGKAVDAGDYATATSIYENGMNVPGRALRAWANKTDFVKEPTWGAYQAFYDGRSGVAAASGDLAAKSWLDSYVSEALAGTGPWTSESGRSQTVKKGVGSGIQVAYILHYVDVAVNRTKNGQTDTLRGAPRALDEAWAIFAGNGEAACNVLTIADKRKEAFGTVVEGSCISKVEAAMVAAFNDALKTSQAGDVAGVEAAAAEIKKQFVIMYAQATIMYADKVDKALAEGKDITAAQAEGFAFFRTIAPLVAQSGAAGEKAAQDILSAFENPAQGIGAQVKSALESTYADLGINAEDVGVMGAAKTNCSPSP